MRNDIECWGFDAVIFRIGYPLDQPWEFFKNIDPVFTFKTYLSRVGKYHPSTIHLLLILNPGCTLELLELLKKTMPRSHFSETLINLSEVLTWGVFKSSQVILTWVQSSKLSIFQSRKVLYFPHLKKTKKQKNFPKPTLNYNCAFYLT